MPVIGGAIRDAMGMRYVLPGEPREQFGSTEIAELFDSREGESDRDEYGLYERINLWR